MKKYREWLVRLRRGEDGEDVARPSTWRLDDLWRAACSDLTVAEYRMTLKNPDRSPDPIGEFLKANQKLNRQMKGMI